MDIVRERLEREYDLELLATTPNVEYEVDAHRRQRGRSSTRPARCPTAAAIEEIREPYIRATILCPKEHVGAVMELCQERRGTHVDMTFLSPERVQLHYDLPLAEIVLDFFDQLKSRTQGLRLARLRADRHARRPTSSSSTSCSPATRSTRSRWSSTGTRPTPPAAR